MSRQISNVMLRCLKLIGGEIVGASLFLLVMIVYTWASDEGSAWQDLFLWMSIITIVLPY